MEFTKEQLIEHLRSRIEHRKGLIASIHIDRGYRDYLKLELRSSEIALASLEAEAVGEFYHEARWGWYEISEGDSVPERARIPLYRVPPAPISVPAAMEMDDDFDSAFEHGKAVGWNACRAAMLQGAEPVMTAYKLPFEQWLSQQTGTIDVECGCVMTEVFFHWLRVAYEAGNSPVIPDGWVLVPVEPTMSQEFAGYRTLTDTGKMSRLMKTRLSNIYRAMIAAAPQQEVKP
ncbi:TPA: hypothetical protein KE812_001249 [Enterobacter cloacae]|nr:hypothetical protein [Enterobacter cloacae]